MEMSQALASDLSNHRVLQIQLLHLHTRDMKLWASGPGWNLRSYISNDLPGDAQAALPRAQVDKALRSVSPMASQWVMPGLPGLHERRGIVLCCILNTYNNVYNKAS